MPENWNCILTKYEELFSISICNELRIIHPSMNACSTPINETEAIMPNNSTKALKIVPNNITFPWNEKHWNVFITNPVSTVEVWGRIIGPEYSVRYKWF